MLISPALAYADADCTPSRLMIVLDKSSSMLDAVDASNVSKWSIAKAAITQVVNAYENKIDLGINIFPSPNQCAPGKTVVTPGAANADEIITAFGADPPLSGNYTPMAQSIDAAAADASLADVARRPSILLVTDGWQWCYPYANETRSWPIDAVKRAKAQGIAVYVVGFGGAVDVPTMNKMAVEAGTAIAGCDPSGTTSASPNKCYYQADSAADLVTALQTVSIQVSAETCDGKDNDCDGQIDEDLARDCATACGTGTETCNLGNWVGCNAPAPAAEICDGVDNDCDGSTDEGLDRACSSVCGSGSEMCVNGAWEGCTAPLPSPEMCADGMDNDCDGSIDEDCECVPGTVKDCAAQGVGACATAPGHQTCEPDGTWGDCVNAVFAGSPERCNNIDDDCDGEIDNGTTDQLCPAGGVCVDGHCAEGPAVGVSQPDGCGCSVGQRPDLNGAVLLLLAFAGFLVLRRRRA